MKTYAAISVRLIEKLPGEMAQNYSRESTKILRASSDLVAFIVLKSGSEFSARCESVQWDQGTLDDMLSSPARYICKDCGLEFSGAQALGSHVAYVHNPKPALAASKSPK